MAIKRYLVMVQATGAVLSVVWDEWWFKARERAEQVHRDEFRIGQLLVELCPLLPEEEGREHPYNAVQLAIALGKQMHNLPKAVAVAKTSEAELRERLRATLPRGVRPSKKKKVVGRKWKKKAKHRRS